MDLLNNLKWQLAVAQLNTGEEQCYERVTSPLFPKNPTTQDDLTRLDELKGENK